MKGNKAIYVILFAALVIRIIFLVNDFVFWDGAVYAGMGKALFSLGKSGLWEPSRPLLWPLFLGFFWKLGLNPVLAGKILTTLFSLGCIYLTYLVGKEIFNEKVGLISSIFLAFSSTFLYYNSALLTEIPSTFFALLGFYFFIKEKTFLAGAFLGLGFLTRFYQGLILISLISLFYFFRKTKGVFKKNLIFLSSFLLVTAPYFILNYYLYKDALYPFSLQIFLSKNSGWLWNEPFSFYFISFLRENLLLVFSIAGIAMAIRSKNYQKLSVLFIALAFLCFFLLVSHKEMRFMIQALPYLYMLAAYGLFFIFNKLKSSKTTATLLLAILAILWLVQTALSLPFQQPLQEHIELQSYLEQDLDGSIWVSNPVYAVNSDNRINLIYYPVFDTEHLMKMKETIRGAKHVLISTCDISCVPRDKKCPAEANNFISLLKQNFKQEHYIESRGCEDHIFISSP